MRSRVLLLLLTVALTGTWMFIGPVSLGGGAAYVTTHGNSMEPGFRTGDLAIVRPADEYAVGDVTAYHSDRMKTVVMHRIIEVSDGRYTLQGDNNDFIDPDRPTEEDLVGKLAVRIPRGGIWLDRLTSPIVLGLLAFGLLATGGTAARTRHGRRRKTVSQHAARTHLPRRSMTGLPPWATTTAVAAGITGVLGVGLAALAWTAPTTTPGAGVTDTDPDRAMRFSYRAEVPESPAYDGTTVTAPDPIFRKLTDDVEVTYTYRGEPGMVSAAAELSTASGWHSSVPLAATTDPIDGGHTGTIALDLDALDQRAQAAAEATGIPATQVDVTVVPTITTEAGDTFAPELPFTLTPLQLTLAGDPSTLTVGAAGEPTSATPSGPATATIDLAGRELPVPTARTLSLVLAGAALLAAVLIALFARLSAPATEAAAIHRRYGQMLVRVQPMAAPAGRPVIDVVDFATLVKLAERYELLILHWRRSDVETFVVQDQETTYRYRTGVGVVRESTERVPAVL